MCRSFHFDDKASPGLEPVKSKSVSCRWQAPAVRLYHLIAVDAFIQDALFSTCEAFHPARLCSESKRRLSGKRPSLNCCSRLWKKQGTIWSGIRTRAMIMHHLPYQSAICHCCWCLFKMQSFGSHRPSSKRGAVLSSFDCCMHLLQTRYILWRTTSASVKNFQFFSGNQRNCCKYL